MKSAKMGIDKELMSLVLKTFRTKVEIGGLTYSLSTRRISCKKTRKTSVTERDNS